MSNFPDLLCQKFSYLLVYVAISTSAISILPALSLASPDMSDTGRPSPTGGAGSNATELTSQSNESNSDDDMRRFGSPSDTVGAGTNLSQIVPPAKPANAEQRFLAEIVPPARAGQSQKQPAYEVLTAEMTGRPPVRTGTGSQVQEG